MCAIRCVPAAWKPNYFNQLLSELMVVRGRALAGRRAAGGAGAGAGGAAQWSEYTGRQRLAEVLGRMRTGRSSEEMERALLLLGGGRGGD